MNKSFTERSPDVAIYEQVFDAILEQRLVLVTRLSEGKLGQFLLSHSGVNLG